jgi:hypothetical protein
VDRTLFVLTSWCKFLILILQLSLTDEWFNIDDRYGSGILTSETEICSNMRAAAQELLNHYVRMQGLSVSQAGSFKEAHKS